MEQKGLTNNLKEILDRIPAAPEPKTGEKKLQIDRLEIINTNVKVKLLPIPIIRRNNYLRAFFSCIFHRSKISSSTSWISYFFQLFMNILHIWNICFYLAFHRFIRSKYRCFSNKFYNITGIIYSLNRNYLSRCFTFSKVYVPVNFPSLVNALSFSGV